MGFEECFFNLEVGDVCPAVSRPNARIAVEPPQCEVGGDVVNGLENRRDLDGGAVKSLVALDSNVASPKEAQRY